MQSFSVGQIQEVLFLRLDPGEMLLESLEKFVKDSNLRDGAILTAVGSLTKCEFHTVEGDGTHPSTNLFLKLSGSIEIISLTGLIVDYEPHLHISVRSNDSLTGGHLEHGCQVFTMVELSLAVFSSTTLTRIRTPEITGYNYKNLREIVK